MTGIPPMKIFRSLLPFLLATLVTLILLSAFPQLSLMLL
jgi:TRAP-type C4-dicarboxylate transport system permease large subunit